jgi:hypothetical protein
MLHQYEYVYQYLAYMDKSMHYFSSKILDTGMFHILSEKITVHKLQAAWQE